MRMTMDGQVSEVERVAAVQAPDEPTCIFAALIDGLTSPERYLVEVHDGELFIAPAHRRSDPRPAMPAASERRAVIGF
jgi:hypothetical protein